MISNNSLDPNMTRKPRSTTTAFGSSHRARGSAVSHFNRREEQNDDLAPVETGPEADVTEVLAPWIEIRKLESDNTPK